MTSFHDDFQYRVNYAAQCIRRGITSRRRDHCFENDDGDLVVVALIRRARKNSEFMAAVLKHWRRDTLPKNWLELEETYRGTATRDLPTLARKMREETATTWEKRMQTWTERNRQASADQAPLPSQDNIAS